MILQDLLNACQGCYDQAPLVAGPHNRDGALVTTGSDGSIILSFRGTLVEDNLTSVLDWLNDFHADLVVAQGFPGRVHAGFLGSLNNLWPQVEDALKEYSDKIPWQQRLYITGHSKGGALAQLASIRLLAWQPIVVTFAAPRCGDYEFASLYPRGRLTRYEAENDLVPFLPFLGYHPAGSVYAQDGLPEALRKIKIDKLIAEWDWHKVINAHHLDTSYRKWLMDFTPPPATSQLAA